MKFITAQGTKIEGVTHLLFSPQWGTDCGIRRSTKKEDVLNITDSDEITCPECLRKLYADMAFLMEISNKKQR